MDNKEYNLSPSDKEVAIKIVSNLQNELLRYKFTEEEPFTSHSMVCNYMFFFKEDKYNPLTPHVVIKGKTIPLTTIVEYYQNKGDE